jgi:nucleotide-binding universal stress UspA family protein
MKILLATDGSPHARAALEAVLQRPWPPRTHVRVLSVVYPAPYMGDPGFIGAAAYNAMLAQEAQRADADAGAALRELRKRAPRLTTSKKVLEGSPKVRIVEEAERWKADLVVVGSHGLGSVARFLLGSVAQAVAQHAPCSVEIVRARPRSLARGKRSARSARR